MIQPVSLLPDWPAPKHVRLVSTTRAGGYSKAPYDSFNLALHTRDDKTDVVKNRAKLREVFQLPSEPVWLNQIHGNCVVALGDTLSETATLIDADASWTKQKNRVCAVLTADCLPVFITDINGSVVAIAHAGWKGLLAGVISATVKALGIDSQNILVWLGPAIGQKAFVVSDDVMLQFSEKNGLFKSAFDSAQQGWHCDLYQLARTELSLLGVEQIFGGGLCTYSSQQQFYSYRRDGENTGRQANCIWLDSP